MYIIAHTYSGGRDLYYGVPNDLLNSKVVEINYIDSNQDNYETKITLETENGSKHYITILQEKID